MCVEEDADGSDQSDRDALGRLLLVGLKEDASMVMVNHHHPW
jgi:hypothetical protein